MTLFHPRSSGTSQVLENGDFFQGISRKYDCKWNSTYSSFKLLKEWFDVGHSLHVRGARQFAFDRAFPVFSPTVQIISPSIQHQLHAANRANQQTISVLWNSAYKKSSRPDGWLHNKFKTAIFYSPFCK